jgi:hypothetical protein
MEALSDIVKSNVSAFTIGGGGGSTNVGTSTIDFGASPGADTATVVVTGQSGITTTSYIQVWIMGTDSTADHNAYTHSLFPMWVQVTPISITDGVGFTLRASNTIRLRGQVKVRWSWA